VGIFEVKVFSFMLNAKNNNAIVSLIARIIVAVIIIVPAMHGGGIL